MSDPAGGTMEAAAMARVNRRLLPFLFLLYIVCFIDRTNVSFAALQMNRDLGLSDAVYGLGAGVFFLGYALFEVPSNLMLARVGARRWIGRIAITLGRAGHGHAVRAQRHELPGDAVPAGRGGGGLLPRHHLLPEPLVSRSGTWPGPRRG